MGGGAVKYQSWVARATGAKICGRRGMRAYEWLVLAGQRRRGSPGFATNFQPSRAILGSMGIRPKHVEKAMRALRRRQPLLEAWLDALNRLEGPSCQIVRVPNTAQERRPLMQAGQRPPGRPHTSAP